MCARSPIEYPSDIHIDAVVFEKGRVQLDGHADFFAEPTMAVKADLTLTDIELADVAAAHAPSIRCICRKDACPPRGMWNMPRRCKRCGSAPWRCRK